MKLNYINIIFLAMLLLFSCKPKEEPIASVDELVFGMSGVFENQMLDIQAGKNDFYMSTDFSSDTQNVLTFMGDLKQNCSSCKQSLKINIRNYCASKGIYNYSPDSSFYNGNYNFQFDGISPKLYKVNFKAKPQGSGTVAHLWDFGDGTTSASADPSKDFKPTGNYLITYTAAYSSGCNSTLSYYLNLSPSVSGMNNLDFGYSYIGNGLVNLFADSAFGNLIWYDGTVKISSNPSTILQLDSAVKRICLKRITGTDTVEVCKNIPSQNYMLCNANFTQYSLGISDPFHLSEITIVWTDANGNIFTSRKVRQSASQFFKIISSSDYISNENGQKTRKISVEFDCLLSDGTRTIAFKNVKGTFAVAYP